MRTVLVMVLVGLISLFVAPLKAGAAPLIWDVYAIPSVLGPAGGTVTVLALETSVAPATCQIRFDGSLLGGQSAPLLMYSKAAAPCQNTVAARVTIGALPVRSSETLSFAFTVRNASTSMTKAFTVTVERQRLWTDTGAPVMPAASKDWSGYVLKGGPYAAVTGTFQVPLLYPTAGCRDTYSEWVGVDGVDDDDLLQAGISEQMSTFTGTCTKHPQVWAWWEELPGAAAPFVTLGVRPGQWVTVTIAEISGSWWFLSVSNDSTGDSVSTQAAPYSGPHSSAEWVVEAPASNLCSTGAHLDGLSLCNMAGFAGQTRFTEVDALGPAREILAVDLVQHTVEVAAPSPVWSLSQLLAGGFDVRYSGLALPAPLHLLDTEPTLEYERP